jgi:F-box and WD-40 domain protein 1/11
MRKGRGEEATVAGALPEPPHHPHIADAGPARVFKLQFDARRIICCCQTFTIVGWDFCNGDVELEAVGRFFTTIT